MIQRFSKAQHQPTSAGESDVNGGHRPARSSRPTTIELHLLKRLLQSVGNPPVMIELWDGSEIAPPAGDCVGRIKIHDRTALGKILADPNFQFGEMYAAQRIDVSGDLDVVMTRLFEAINHQDARQNILSRVLAHLRKPRATHERASKENIYRHYDIGNDFYRMWLDDSMAYTCAYFPRRDATLEEAQRAKFDHVCRKVRLKPDMVVVEAGCGWGGLALHMAREYGVRVRAYNISHEQVAFARQRARAEGLDERVMFIEDDWRNIKGPCDAFVSVGMLEHVGQKNLRELGRVIDNCLTEEGRGLIHSIGQNQPKPFSPWIERRIFPGAYPPALSEMMDIFGPFELTVLDVENIRLHYAQTLRHWLARFEKHVDEIREMFDEKFVRMWRLYLAGSVAAFETGVYQLFQIVFNRSANNDVPWTRDYLYQSEETKAQSAAARVESEVSGDAS